MSEEEKKWIEEARDSWNKLSQYVSIGFGFDLYLKGYLQACKARQEEIERLKRYEVRWWRLKDQLRRDREQGHLVKTARVWLLMQELEEAK